MDENKCAFCPEGKADLQTVSGQPICIDCANACPALIGEGAAVKLADAMIAALNSKPNPK